MDKLSIQLQNLGKQDMLFVGQPSFSYFKGGYEQHTKFAMRHLNIPFLTNCVINNQTSTIVQCVLQRYSDLVGEMYFEFTLPDIYCGSYVDKDGKKQWYPKFEWCEYIAETLVKSSYVLMGKQKIDNKNSWYTHVNRILKQSTNQREKYEKLIGHRREMYDPEGENMGTYPYWIEGQSKEPTIKGRTIRYPLDFWFCKDESQYLPLIALQKDQITIVLELRPLNEIYRLYYQKNGTYGYYAPDIKNAYHSLVNYTKEVQGLTTGSIDIGGQMKCKCVILTDQEREKMVYGGQMNKEKNNETEGGSMTSYLIEETTQDQRYEEVLQSQYENEVKNSTIRSKFYDLQIYKMCKEIIWIMYNEDYNKEHNSWFKYESLIENAELNFNGVSQTGLQSGEYYNELVPYESLSNGRVTKGVYYYTFALRPEDILQPSGEVNMSKTSKINLRVDLDESKININDQYTIEISYVTYNILSCQGGVGGALLQ